MLDAERNRVFEGWIDAHKAILFKVARVYGATHSDREDLFQEIALQVWHSVTAYRGDCAATTWIYRVALNTALAWSRKERRHGRGRQDIDAAAGLLIAPSSRDPRLDWIYERIAELDETNRSLALLMLDGFSYREMSEILGLGESNVGMKINRIKAAFAAQLAKEESMDFDQMFETWRAQNTAPPYDVNRDAFRQSLQTEEARVRREMRTRRRRLWVAWIVGTAMAVFAGFWIAITITNGWPAIYVITSGVSFGLFALGVGVLWLSRRREPERNFGNTLEEEVRGNLALLDHQLSLTRYWMLSILGAASVVIGAMLFSWTVTRSQDIPDSPPGWWSVWLVVFFLCVSHKERNQMRKEEPKLELRQRRLRELLAAIEARES